MLFVRLVLSLVFSPRVQEESGREKMVLIAVEAVPAGSMPPAAVNTCVSPRVRDTALALHRLCRPGRHSCEEEPEVRLSRQSWSNSLGRCRAFLQSSYLRFLLDLLQRPPPLESLGVKFYVCLDGETWLPSFMHKACYMCIISLVFAVSSFNFLSDLSKRLILSEVLSDLSNRYHSI